MYFTYRSVGSHLDYEPAIHRVSYNYILKISSQSLRPCHTLEWRKRSNRADEVSKVKNKIIMASGEDDRRRYPRNLQGILKMAVDHSDDPTSSTSSVFQEMSEEVTN